MTLAYTTPGVYEEAPPRVVPAALPRTDVAGFVGFERRIRDGSTPSRLIGSPPVGHKFAIDVAPLRVRLGGRDSAVAAHRNLVLSADDHHIPIAPGGSVAYAVVAYRSGDAVVVTPVRGAVASDDRARTPTDAEVEAALSPGTVSQRLGGVHVRRSAMGDRVHVLVLPGVSPVRCDDWNDFVGALGPVDDADTAVLGRAVRGFFAAGGRRCHVALVSRPQPDDDAAVERAARELVGVAGHSRTEATGLERLLLIDEVSLVDVPDLYAQHVDPDRVTRTLPPLDLSAKFRPCDRMTGPVTAAQGHRVAHGPIFDDAVVAHVQREMLTRCARQHWRVLLLLTAPVEFDAWVGRFASPTTSRAIEWRRGLRGVVNDRAASCAAFYFPWVIAHDQLGGADVEIPPTGVAGGVIAKRDLARGPHIAPANESIRGIVGLARPVDDATNERLYRTPNHLNPLRTRPGRGIRLWGARTLSSDRWLRHVAVRRCLGAIERQVKAAFDKLVFEPNTPALWLQMAQTVLSILLPIFDAGALRGESQAEAFYIRCDESTNPADQVALGRVVCEVGVAIAAPAEFIVFRVAKLESAVEITEAS